MSLPRLLKSSIGAKTLMAITGIMLMLFVLGHMLGNLQIFISADQINHYAETLQGLGNALWLIRGSLLVILLAHLGAALQVTRLNRAARPVPYQHALDYQTTTFASRTMMFTGLIIVAFVIYHILHFTVVTDANLAGIKGTHDDLNVYGMIVAGFSNTIVSLVYIVANILLGVHLTHGAKSLFQTLNLRTSENANCLENFSKGFGVLVILGNCSIPVAVLMGILS
ncbi:MAG: succinate dehydrogenase cytochrome b subunit [Planctomycetes bacterium]|nr:succinate dehydrogenase cytochrome b subunit [Planctomycetota bacterium]MBT4029743.1 succinate dehydrogenase cytochrome b subunit [Planctomycetota bacterium]MBT4559865.1 succinate dehydrogenase cytochrome b subunit [Planctomycetota bacterium]MBT5100584.1 succinate dehydrogenase cytochrome b subunit [Planctomycetota bacterium]MBT5120069.1 succinate dehydrogenase cytochrome b subunit [Planctomycetota bacterium]